MTRQEIEETYDVRDGIIHSLGKFESEPVYAPYFYEASLDGSAEEFLYGEGDPSEYLIAVTDEDRAIFPELSADTAFVLVYESESGFVYASQFTADEADKARTAYEKWCEENAEESD